MNNTLKRDGTQKTRYAIYDFIVWYKKEYDGNSPSVREIAEAVEINTTSTISMHIENLIEEGLLYRHPHAEPKTARVLCVTGGSWKLPED